MSTALAATPTGNDFEDTRRITEDDPDYKRLHNATVARLRRSLRAYARELLQGEPGADTRFIDRHENIIRQAYEAAHREGQRDYWPAVSNRQIRHRYIQPPKKQVQERMAWYALPSAMKMAHEVKVYWREQQVAALDESIQLAAPADIIPPSFDNRTVLQGQVVWSGLQDGYAAAGASDTASPYALLWWNLGPAKVHCFPGGTLIATPDGERAIETIRVGDLVQTIHGARRVTRLYRDLYFGELAHVEAAGHTVDCTPNHPFLTQRGWIPASELCADDAVFLQDGPHVFAAHVRLPDAYNGVATGSQVGILSAVSALLRKLPLRQWLEARMSVPVVAVGLDDERADADVYDELLLNHSRWFERDAETLQDSTQIPLKFARLVTLDPLMGDSQAHVNVRHFLWMRRTPSFDLGLHFRTLHRVLFGHMSTRGLMDQPAMRSLRETQTKITCFAADLFDGIAERLRYSYSTFGRKVFTEVFDLCRSPQFIVNSSMLECSPKATAATALGTQRFGSIPDMPTLRADLYFSRFVGWPAEGRTQVAIPAQHTTEALSSRTSPVLRKRHSTLFTNVLHRHSGTPPVLDSSIPHSTVVFNLEVEGVHQYVANGFVVHNCDDCPMLALGSPYDPPSAGFGSNQLDQTPGDGQTACGAACKCSLSYDYPSGDALVQLGQAIASNWNDWMPEGDTSAGAPEPVPVLTPPAKGAPPLTPKQKGALDSFRNASAGWDVIRRQLPPAPGLFSTETELPSASVRMSPWNTLTKEQQAAITKIADAQSAWLQATAKLVPPPEFQPDPQIAVMKWLQDAAEGKIVNWNDAAIAPYQQTIEQWLEKVAGGNVIPWPPPTQPSPEDVAAGIPQPPRPPIVGKPSWIDAEKGPPPLVGRPAWLDDETLQKLIDQYQAQQPQLHETIEGATIQMASTPSPNATVGTVHQSSPQGAIMIRPRGSNLPKASPRAKRPKNEKLHDPVRRGQGQPQ